MGYRKWILIPLSRYLLKNFIKKKGFFKTLLIIIISPLYYLLINDERRINKTHNELLGVISRLELLILNEVKKK